LLDLEAGRLLFNIIPRKGNGEVRLGGGTYAIFSYVLEFFNKLGLMTE
jgi:hypothetical protein